MLPKFPVLFHVHLGPISCAAFLDTVFNQQFFKMSLKCISVFLLIAASIAISVDAYTVKCKGQDIEIKDEQLQEKKECFAAVGISSQKELSVSNAGCFTKCLMMKKGLIDDTGKPLKENINKMGENLPEALKAELTEAVGKCLDNEGSKIDITATDKTCASFLPLGLCMKSTYLSVCKSEM